MPLFFQRMSLRARCLTAFIKKISALKKNFNQGDKQVYVLSMRTILMLPHAITLIGHSLPSLSQQPDQHMPTSRFLYSVIGRLHSPSPHLHHPNPRTTIKMPPKLPDFLSPNPANRTTMRSAPGRRNKSKLAESLNASMNTSSGPKTGPNSPTAQSANINDLISFETDFDAAIPSTAVAENPSSPSFPPQNPEFPNLLDMDSAVAASKPSSSSSTFPRYQTGQPTKFPSLDSTTNAPSPQSPTATTTTPLLLSYPLMTKAEASAAWAFALEEAEDEIKFPPVRPVVHALYATMEEMLQAQERGVHDPCTPPPAPHLLPSSSSSPYSSSPSLSYQSHTKEQKTLKS